MEKEYLMTFLYPLSFAFFAAFFIFATAVAVYLKIFIQKMSSSKDFIVSKYMGGILNGQFNRMRWFYIAYDFFMLSVLSLLAYSIPAITLFGFDEKPYMLIGSFFLLIFLLTAIIPLDELKGITKPKWIIQAGAPDGITMIWQDRSKFGYVYNFFMRSFVLVLLALAVFFILSFYGVLS